MPKYYVGFDVGIKNLAFCVIDKDQYTKYASKKSDDPGIVHWENINLLKSEVCSGLIKSGKKKGDECGKTASFVESGNYYYCGQHKPESSKKYKQKTSKNQSTDYLMEIVFRALDLYPIFGEVASIVIELQPRINPKMKTISNGIQAYFIIRQKIDNPESQLRVVKYSSAKNKMKVYKGKIITSPQKTKYLRTKDIGEKHTELILERSPETLDRWYSHSKKKDDLADAFLHCCWSIG